MTIIAKPKFNNILKKEEMKNKYESKKRLIMKNYFKKTIYKKKILKQNKNNSENIKEQNYKKMIINMRKIEKLKEYNKIWRTKYLKMIYEKLKNNC